MTRQLDLFASVLHAYSAERGGILDNKALYADVAERAGLDASVIDERVPIGASGQQHSLFARRVRWFQQTLKHAGVLEKVEGERGVWRLTTPASGELNKIDQKVSVVGFSTELGIAILGCCETVFSRIDSPITLCLTSPPYPLAKQRAYGNVAESQWVDWICKMLEPIVKNLVRGGSICLNISNDIFVSGTPARSLYRERLILALHDRLGLHKIDELIWSNPSKAPGPVRWASMERVLTNVSWEPVYWLSNDPKALRSDNRRVLQAHTERHLQLIRRGGENRTTSFSDGAYNIHPGRFGNETAGRIPRNMLEIEPACPDWDAYAIAANEAKLPIYGANPVLTFGHSCADQRKYKEQARAAGLPAHGAPMPLKLASFLIEFMTEQGELVVDPFGGSFTTAKAAELLGRRWLSTECMVEYVIGSAMRFQNAAGFHQNLAA